MPVTLAHWTAHQRRQQNPLWPSSSVFWNDVAILAVTCAGAFSVNLVGSLPGDEILILILFPFLAINHGKRAFRREYLWFYILLGGWLFGTIVGDLYLGTSLANKLKGIARVVFFGLDFAVLAMLIDRKTRGIIVFALGVAVIFALNARNFGGVTAWKYGSGYALSIVALLGSSYFFSKRRYSICILIILVLAALNLVFAFRSQIGVDLVSGALSLPAFASVRSHRRIDTSRTSEILRVTVLLGLAMGAALGANQVVKYAAGHNFFDADTEAKFESQSAGRLGVLVGGRPETLVAIRAILDSPIIGHGSFAVSQRYLQMMQDIQYEYGYSGSDETVDLDNPGIPTHSHLTQAWVESGILGGIFWIYIVIVAVRGIFRLVLNRPTMAPLYCFFLISFIWDIFYSPMGSVNRMTGDFYILISYDLLKIPTAKAFAVYRRRRDRPVHARQLVRLSRSGR